MHARVVSTQALCGLLLLLACRWFVVVWQLRVIVPLPLIYGIAVLPVLTLVGLMVPMLFSAGDGCGCAGSGCQWLCSERARKVVSVLCATLDVALSLGLSGGLVYLVNGLATEPDQSLNVYWSGTLRSFVFVLIESILGASLHPALPQPLTHATGATPGSLQRLFGRVLEQHFCCTLPLPCRDTAAHSEAPPRAA